MRPLAEEFFALPADRRRRVHLELCRGALEVWTRYCRERPRIEYTDSVVGLGHVLDAALPGEALRTVELGADPADVKARYGEPIVALQDDDLELPEEIEFAYYAIHNLFLRYGLAEPIDDWLIVNQAVSALGVHAAGAQGAWDAALEAALLKARAEFAGLR
jgi:hypothetical protein